MAQQQQPDKNPLIEPSLSELDTPPTTETEKKEPEDILEDNPTKKPSPSTEAEDKKPPVDKQKTETEDEETEEEEEEEEVVVDEEASKAFWEEVKKLRGDDVPIEFPTEVQDHLSPQAILHIMRQSEERGAEEFENNLQRMDSRSYSYMLHRAKGGSDEEFFAVKTEVLPEWDVLKASVDLQQAFYKRALTRKGLEPDQADMLVKEAIDKNKLATLVESEYTTTKKYQDDQLLELKRLNEQQREKETQQINKMASTLQEMILKNQQLPITIPEAKRPEFLQFVSNLLVFDREDGRWYINQEFNKETLPDILGSLYFLHVKGSLDDIIVNKVNQKATAKLRLKMSKDVVKKSSKADPNKTEEKPGVFTPVSEL